MHTEVWRKHGRHGSVAPKAMNTLVYPITITYSFGFAALTGDDIISKPFNRTTGVCIFELGNARLAAEFKNNSAS